MEECIQESGLKVEGRDRENKFILMGIRTKDSIIEIRCTAREYSHRLILR